MNWRKVVEKNRPPPCERQIKSCRKQQNTPVIVADDGIYKLLNREGTHSLWHGAKSYMLYSSAVIKLSLFCFNTKKAHVKI